MIRIPGVDEETLDQQPPDTTEPSAIFSIYGSFGSIMKSKGIGTPVK